MTPEISVVLADNHLMVREALARWLDACPDIRIAVHVSDADEAINAALRCRPTVVILDIDMPGRDCFNAARAISAALPDTRIIFLSAFVHDRFIEQVLALRAAGYVTKRGSVDELTVAIRGACAGQVYFSPEVRARIVADARGAHLAKSEATRISTLSTREVEVLRQVARGLSQKEIAVVMHLSPDTIHTHVANLMKKLQVHSKVDLATFAVREGLIALHGPPVGNKHQP